MTYWVYENWVAESKAVIHESTCRFCNDGSGTGRNLRGDRNGKWHGAFGSLGEAEAAARQTGDRSDLTDAFLHSLSQAKVRAR